MSSSKTVNMKTIKLNVSELIGSALCWMFAVTFVIFNTNSLPGYDAYYNVQIAEIMSKGTWAITEFPWTTCSIWADFYFDKEWLFHVYLIPFIALFGKIQGAKIATIMAVFFMGLSWGILLKALGLKKHLFSAMIFMLFATGYLFLGRIVLCRSILFSLIFLPLAITCAIQGKRLLLFIVIYLYTLSYVGAWQALPIILIFDAFGIKKHEPWSKDLKKMMFPYVVAGLVAGVIFNPYFPVNIKGIFIQTILVLKAKWFGVGGGEIMQASELAPISSKRVLWHLPLFIIYGYTVHSMWMNRSFKEMRRPAGVFFILSTLYLVLTIFSQRFIEYLAPFFAVFVIMYWYEFPNKKWFDYDSDTKIHISPHKFRITFLLIFLLFGGISIALLNKNFYRENLFYKDSTDWLKGHVKENEIIFTGDWDKGAVLFFHAPEFRYLVMLEPYFMYAHSPEKYFLWNKICQGKISRPSIPIVNEFNSTVVFVPHDAPALLSKLRQDNFAQLEYEGKHGEAIYILRVPKQELMNDKKIKSWIKKH